MCVNTGKVTEAMMTVVAMVVIDPIIVGMAEIAIVEVATAEIDTMIVGMGIDLVATVIVVVDMAETGTTIVGSEIVNGMMIAEVAIAMETETEDVKTMSKTGTLGVKETVPGMQEAILIEMSENQVREAI